MILDFEYLNDGLLHDYCYICHAETVRKVYQDDKTSFYCESCRATSNRKISIDPSIVWWVDDTRTYWHESAGVFIRNRDNKFLFFNRTVFPFAYTIPAGHVDADEDPYHAATREVREEIGLNINNMKLIAEENIDGDSCSRGCDNHKWFAYIYEYNDNTDISVIEEGKDPVWLSLNEALNLQDRLITPNYQIILKYYKQLSA